MVEATHTSYSAADRSYFSILKKDVHQKAQNAGFNTQKLGEIDIIVAELTSNLHKYAQDGELLVGLSKDEQGFYIEILTIDNGPGMADPARMMQDGYTTGTSMGHGLGSIKRLSDVFDLFSIKGWGTIVLSRVYLNEYSRPMANRAGSVEVSPLVVAKPGQQVSGDGFYQKYSNGYLKLLVADGLGHGPEANFAVSEAVNAFKSYPSDSPVEILRYLHQSIRKTRGMVGTALMIDSQTKAVTIAGIGNISTKLFTPAGLIKTQAPYNGIIGHNIPNTMNNQEVAVSDYHLLILCSDGIRSRWDISKYQGIHRCHLIMVSAAIYKDFSRRTDDTSVIVVKLK